MFWMPKTFKVNQNAIRAKKCSKWSQRTSWLAHNGFGWERIEIWSWYSDSTCGYELLGKDDGDENKGA